MEKVDALIKSLEPEIDLKCAEIRQKKNERFLTKLFIIISAMFLVIPAVLVFFGISLIAIFAPVLFVSAVFLAAMPILVRKGEEAYE